MVKHSQVIEPLPVRLGARTRLREQIAQSLVIAALCAAPAWVCIHMAIVNDPDVWWHMRTGEWIVQHHAVPHTDFFSAYGAGRPWAAYSWLFDLIIFRLFQLWGLVGIQIYSASMVAAVTAALYHLVERLQSDFTVSIAVTCVAWSAMMPIYTPRPWLFTLLFYALELDILMHARKTGEKRELLWLPIIFALWSNLHIQFIDGFIVLAIALAESILARRWRVVETRLPMKWAGSIFFSCAIACFANPYGWRIYQIARELATQAGVLDNVEELHALPFRLLANYLVLGLALAAAFILGWRRRVAIFETGLLSFAAFACFRSQRDVWVLVIAACAILAAGIESPQHERRALPGLAFPVVGVATALFVFLGFRTFSVNNTLLNSLLKDTMPVAAVEQVRTKNYAGPLYNDYSWGGFFIWYLRTPVSIDGRAALHGTERMERFTATWKGEPEWSKDPDLKSAGVVIGPIKAPLTQLLRMDPAFELAFEDKIAAVFVARHKQAHP